MKRRAFLKGAAVAATGGVIASKPRLARAAKSKFRWRMALAIPKTLPVWGPGMERFAKNVEKLSGGSLRIKVYGAGELVPAFGTFNSVKAGEIQMAHSAAYYQQGKIPASVFFSSVPFGLSVNGMLGWMQVGGGQQLYDRLMHPHGVQCFASGATGYQMTGWFNKEIKSLEDLSGLKIRIPGIAGKVYAKAGAKPVLLSGGEVFTSLSTGVIDAVEWVGPYHDHTIGLHKAAKFYYGSSWHEPGTMLELMINKKAWDSLPEELRLLVQLAANENTSWMQAEWESKNAEYLTKIQKEGKIQIRHFPVDVLKALRTFTHEALQEIASSSSLAAEIYKSFTSFQTEFDSYQKTAGSFYFDMMK